MRSRLFLTAHNNENNVTFEGFDGMSEITIQISNEVTEHYQIISIKAEEFLKICETVKAFLSKELT
jgi:hypothetical protein